MICRLSVACLSIVAMIAASGTSSAAGNAWLDDAAILKRFHDVKIAGEYANGRAFEEHYRADGRVDYAEPGGKIGGRWSVTAGTLCTIYDTDPTGGCFRVAQVGANCFEFYFVARTEDAAPGREGDRPRWTARGSVAGRDATCQEGADV